MTGKTLRWIALLLFVVSIVFAVRLIGPAIPDEIRMLTGPEGTTFHDDGLRFQEILARHGITVHLEETRGSIENLQGVMEADSSTAAIVWGLRNADGRQTVAPEGVESLGTMYLQPLWVFASRDASLDQLRDLSGLRVEAGRDGSDSRVLALFLMNEEGVPDVEFSQDRNLTLETLRESIRTDQVSAVMAVGEPDSLLIDALLREPDLQAMSIERAEAFAIQYPFLKAVRFPEGGHDIGANLPDQDLQLLAASAQFVVSDLFPPALADLLLQAASEVYGGPTAFSSRGTFPNPDSAPLPLNRAAENFYTNGPPALQKYMSFRMAAWINRFLAAAVAMASAAVTLFRLIPALISFPFRRKIKMGFSDLRALERSAAEGSDKQSLLKAWAKVDASSAAIGVPLRTLEPQWLELRQYLHDMRDRLEAL